MALIVVEPLGTFIFTGMLWVALLKNIQLNFTFKYDVNLYLDVLERTGGGC